MRYIFNTIVIFLLIASFTSCAMEFNRVLKSKDATLKLSKANEYYTIGENIFNKQGKLDVKGSQNINRANQLYDELLKTNLKGTPQFDEHFFKYAMTSYMLKDYAEAEMNFSNYMETFPLGKYRELAFLYRGKALYKASPRVGLDQEYTNRAISILSAFLASYPNSSYTTEVQNIIKSLNDKLEEKAFLAAKLYFDREQYNSAQVAYELLVEKYANSPKADFYAYQEIRSAYYYAKNSIIEKQRERYEKALQNIDYFKNGYRESPYLKEINDIEKSIKKELQ